MPAAITTVQRTDRRVAVAATLFGGLFSATSLLMFATGHARAGYMMGVAGALISSVLGALQLMSEDS